MYKLYYFIRVCNRTRSGVGMAIASKWYAATYNREGFELFDYDIYTIAPRLGRD